MSLDSWTSSHCLMSESTWLISLNPFLATCFTVVCAQPKANDIAIVSGWALQAYSLVPEPIPQNCRAGVNEDV